MKQRNRNTIQLTVDQIDALRTALRDASRELELEEGAVDSMETHLSDAQFISIQMGTMLGAELQQCSRHLARCSDCEQVREQMRDLGGVWADEREAARLRERRKASGSASLSIEGILIGFRAALRALIPQRGAYAHPEYDASSAVEFLISEGGEVVISLIGILKRRNREYYARIDAADDESKRRFSGRAVMLTIREPSAAQPILSRRINVGVAVLLGTDLPLTEASMVEARLMRSDED